MANSTTPPRARLPAGLIAVVALLALLLLAALVAIFWREWLTFAASYPIVADLLRFVLFAAPIVLAVGYGVTGLTIWYRRWGWRESVFADKQIALKRAEVQIAPLATSFSHHDSRQNALPEREEEAETPAALTAEAEWLAWTDQAPHLMVAGRTDSGKTTTVEAVLARRILAGDLVLAIDPHYQGGKWLGAHAIGGGRDYAACYQAFDDIRALLDKRYKSFDAGTQTSDFKRVTIVVDEVPAIIAHAQSVSKVMYERWLLFATCLGSEARKVRISIILSTQSPLVRDIGISSAMRENFIRIALGDTAADLLREEPNAAHRQVLLDLLRGRRYPAAMEYRNNWYALRNDDVPQLAQTNGAVPRIPTLLIAPAPMQQPQKAIASSLPPTARVSPAPPRQPAPPTAPIAYTVQDEILICLGAQPERYMSASEIAAAIMADLAVVRTEIDTLYHKAGRLVRRPVRAKTTKEKYEYQIQSAQPAQPHVTPSA